MDTKTVPYSDFQKMLRLAKPGSGVTAENLARALQAKGHKLGEGLEQYRLGAAKPTKTTVHDTALQNTNNVNPFNPFGKGQTTLAGRLNDALPKEGSLVDYLSAPGDAAAGGIIKGIGAMTGMDVSNNPDVKGLSKNLSQSASVARVAIPVAAGIATGGVGAIPSAITAFGAGAGSSLLASGLEKAAGEDQTMGGAAGEALATGTVNTALDLATRGLFSLAKPLFKAKGIAQLSDEATSTSGKIVQSKVAQDIAQGREALQTIDLSSLKSSQGLKEVKTYADLEKVIGDKLDTLIPYQDEIFDAIPGVHKLDTLATPVKVGGKTASDNFVKIALDNLEELYGKKMNTAGILKIQNLRELAESQGLSVRQINDIAREYGGGFKSFSDATGQPLTSVNSQAYETVRKGLKNVSRSLMPNDASKVIDEEMHNLITTKELVHDMVESVQQLSNKVNARPLGEKVGSFIGKVINTASFNTLGGFLKGVTPSNEGLKTMNSLAIQKQLPKNIAKITKLLEQIDTLPEGAVIGRLKEIFGNVSEKVVRGASQAAVGGVSNYYNQ